MSDPAGWLTDKTITKTETVTSYSIKITKARVLQLLRAAGLAIPDEYPNKVGVLVQGIPYERDWELEDEDGTHLEVRWTTKTSSGRT